MSSCHNYINLDIYECEFKLVGRKMANLNVRGGNILGQKCEHPFDHFSSLLIRLDQLTHTDWDI